ncbi:MAG TPA: hypothetical protein DCE75_07515 [Acidimicrobiaceae bacterium]|nr:hypothetical protein [Acidimicrobiaceae bacterium]
MHSECGFAVRHLGMSKVRGRFKTFSGSATINDDLTPARSTPTTPIGTGA